MGLAHTVHQQAGGAEDAGPQRQPAADLAFEIIGDPTADGVDIVKVFAQAAARMGDSVWVGYVADGQPVACRVRVGNHPVHSGGDRASFAVAFDAALLRSRVAAGAFHPESFILMDSPTGWPASDPLPGPSRFGLPVCQVPFRALASRIPAFPQGDRVVALGLLTWMFGYDPTLVRRLLENRLAPRGCRYVSAGLRLFEVGWRDAFRFVPRPFHVGRSSHAMPSGRVEVMSGREALALGALVAGFTACVVRSDHPVVQRWAQGYAALGGRVLTMRDAFMRRALTGQCGGSPCLVQAADPGFEGPVLVVETAGAPVELEEACGPGTAGVMLGMAAACGVPRVTLRFERAPRADALWYPFGVDPLVAASGCPGGARPVVLAPTTVEECYHFMDLARRIAQQYRRDCVVLVDAGLLGAIQAWRRRPGSALWAEWLGEAVVEHGRVAAQVDEVLSGLGMETAPLETFVRLPRPVGGESGDVLLVGWGMTRGPVEEAVARLRARGLAVSALHLRVLAPLPAQLGDVLARFRRVVAIDVQEDPQAATRRAYALVNLLRAAVADRPGRGSAPVAERPAITAHRFPCPRFLGPAEVEAWAAGRPAPSDYFRAVWNTTSTCARTVSWSGGNSGAEAPSAVKAARMAVSGTGCAVPWD